MFYLYLYDRYTLFFISILFIIIIRGLAPPMLIFQSSHLCNIFTKIPKLVPALTQRADFWPIIGLNYLDLGWH